MPGQTTARAASELESLKPRQKPLVMDLVQAAGLDISDWTNFKGRDAAANPKYCYEWALWEPGRLVVLNLWYAKLKEERGTIFIKTNMRESGRKHAERPGGMVQKLRADRFDQALQEARRNALPVRAIINDGTMLKLGDPKSKASHVKHRLLDPVPWAVTSYDWDTGDCILTRGAQPGHVIDQFDVEKETDKPVARKMVLADSFVRDAAVRTRVLNRSTGRCEYCLERGFAMPDGRVYVETHHVIPLGEGGPDTDRNVAALCPNHHRQAHYGSEALVIRQKLLKQLQALRSK